MTADYDINNIFNVLNKIGLDHSFVKSVLLPDWWDDSIAETKAGYLQAVSIIAKRIGIDISLLLDLNDNLLLKKHLSIKFKNARNVSPDSSLWPKIISSKISETIDQIFFDNYKLNDLDPIKVRDKFFCNNSQINLEAILEFLWSNGIPVIFVSKFPSSQRKMDGMIIGNESHPIITISKNRQQDAWFLFIIAHELGHLLKGHISNDNRVIWDSDLQLVERDEEEHEANTAAFQFLTGSKVPKFLNCKYKNPFQLVTEAVKLGEKLKVNPGTIILDFGYRNNDYRIAEQALNIMSPEADAVKLIKYKMKKYLHLDKLTEENYEFFSKITSLEED